MKYCQNGQSLKNKMGRKLRQINKIKIINSYRRQVGRRIHAEARLKERFGLEYSRIKNAIDNGHFRILDNVRGDKICYLKYLEHDIYFIIFRKQIKTFLTKEMLQSSHPHLFKPKTKTKKRKKRKKSVGELIPASKLFGKHGD